MKKNLLFYIAYFLLIISFMFENVYFIKEILDYVEYIGFLLATVLIIKNVRYTKQELPYYLILYGVVIISSIVSHDKSIFKLFFMLYYVGLTDVYISYRENKMRYSYGFGHANMFAYLILLLNMEYVYIKNKSYPFLTTIIAVVSFFTIMYCADSRSSIFIFVLFYLAYILYKKINFEKIFNNKFINYLSSNLFLILTVVSGVLAFMYYRNNPIAIRANSFLSDRLRFTFMFIKNYSIKLFGNTVSFVTTHAAKIYNSHTLVLDNGFYYIIVRYGLIIFLFLCYYIKKNIKYLIEKKDYMLLLILLLLIIYSITENYFVKVNYSVFIFSISSVFFVKRKDSDS